MRRRRGTILLSIGVILLILVAALCVPATIPRTLGYQIYVAVSDDMAPGVTTGSLLYIHQTEGKTIEAGDQLAYYSADGGGVVLQWVIENDTEEQTLTARTEGADASEDQTVSYTQVLGIVKLIIPEMGKYVSFIASTKGVSLLGGMTGLALLFMGTGIVLGSGAKRQEEENGEDENPEEWDKEKEEV
ncbi:MAG: hypothetical protein LUE29_06815 [Lachnospiraceae bacterium]|nr:hypothetical protein [Lachnospiraceae bacterium]